MSGPAPREDRRAPLPVSLQVILPPGSVLIPSWVAIAFMSCFVLATVALLLVWEVSGREIRELRSLQLHAQDVENVLIRSGVGRREDFAPWPTGERKKDKQADASKDSQR